MKSIDRAGVSRGKPLSLCSVGRAFIATALAAVALAGGTLRAVDGDLDSGFGTSGKTTVSFGGSDTAYGSYLQSDGKMIVVGGARPVSFEDFGVARFNVDGTLDTSFGSGGTYSLNISTAGSPTDRATCVGVQSDGKIIVAGYTRGSVANDMCVIRLTPGGVLDTTFGTSGISLIDINGRSDQVYALKVLSDDKIVLGGRASNAANSDTDYAVAKLNANGTLDTNFGVGGKATLSVGNMQDNCNALVVQTDGSIVLGGQSNISGSNFGWAVVRFTAGGAVDTSFGTSGKVAFNLAGSSSDALNGLALQSDGKIVACGANNISNEAAIARFTTAGVLDSTFGSGGIAAISVGGGGRSNQLAAVLVQGDGKILAGGRYVNASNVVDSILVRVTSSGALDSSFGSSGTKAISLGANGDGVVGLGIASSGKILAAISSAEAVSSDDFGVARFENSSVSIPAITSELTASGTYDRAFSTYTITASGAPTSYNASGLPIGLSVNANNGEITGTPTNAGAFNVTVSATNAGGTGTATLVITIAAVAPTITSATSASVNHLAATLGGNVTAANGGAITARGVVLAKTSVNSSPQLAGTGVTNVAGSGTTGVFTVNATGLTPATAYSYKAYATNSAGTAYTSTGTFTTAEETQTESGGASSPMAVNNVQPSLAATWMISIVGTFPSRDGDLVTERILGEIRPIAFEAGTMNSNSGWVACNGQLLPISQNAALFSLLGTAFGGNGITTFALPDLRGRVPVGMGGGAGLTDHTIGEKGGSESFVLSTTHLPAHGHTYNGGNTAPAGGAAAIDNLQPWLALNMCIVGDAFDSATGWIRLFAFNFVPAGHFSCNGEAIAIGGHTSLFATIGTIYGGNGTTTFGLPDLRGRTPVGVGQGMGLSNYEIGSIGGTETIALLTSEIPAHAHPYSAGNTGAAGGSQPHSTRQPYLVVRPVISAFGLFASMEDVPGIGEIRFMASARAPALESGWLPADGALQPIAEYDAFFALIGTTFGGDGQETFAMPDLRGRVLVHQGQGAGLTSHILGEQWGSEDVTITNTQLPAHVHVFASAPAITNNSLIAGGTYGSVFDPFTISATDATSYSATGLPAGLSVNTANGQITGTPTAVGTFNVTIGATNDVGTDSETLLITIAKASQTILWTSIPDTTYGTGAFTVNASSTSGLAIEYSVAAGPATIAGNTVTITGAGAVTLRAEQAGNANFNAAVGANTGFMVGKATATVTLDGLSATYDTAAHAATATTSPGNLTVSFTYEGNATAPTNAGSYAVVGTISDANYQGSASGTLTIGKATATVTLGGLSPTYNGSVRAATATTSPVGLTVNFTYDGNVTAPTNAGSYAVVGTINDANYQGSASGTLAIAKAPLTVTAEAKSRVYGAADPAFAATLTGFVGGDTTAAVSGAASFSNDATATSHVGAYTITPAIGTLSATNYTFTTFHTGVLTIAQAPLTVTADAKSRAYGSAEPTFTATLTGFVNNETSNIVSGMPSFTTDALITSDVGSYTITPVRGTLSATNYSFGFATGALTVTKASLTVTADNTSKIYGAENPRFTASYSGFKNSDTSAVISGTPAFSTLVDATSAVNSYDLDVATGTLAATNYSFSFVPGTLDVTKATLTVTADDKSRGYGSANPEFTAAVAGFVNDDTLDNATTGAPVLTTLAEAMSAQGTYAIDVAAGTLAASNYEFALVDGTLTVTKAVLTITPEDKAKTYGAANPALTYKVSGYLNDDTAAVITGVPSLATTATDTSPVDAYPITADIAALSATNYLFATEPGTLTVKKATLTVTAENKTRVYGAADPTFTATITGLRHTDTLNAAVTGAPAVSTAATVVSGVGSYAITPAAGDLAAANYDFTFVPGTLTVTKAPLAVKADAKSRIYGAGDPAFSATLTGFVGGDTAAVVSGAAAFSNNATAANHVGAYTITPAIGTLSAANYAFTTFNTGVLTIAKAPLTVTADAKSRAYGSAEPAFTATLTGFVNNETNNVVSGVPSFATDALITSNVGSYTITAALGTLTAENYSFGFVPGALTVTKAPLTVAAVNTSKIYGASNPAFTASYSGFRNSDTSAVISGAPAFATLADATSAVSSYDIDVTTGTLAATNYSFGFVSGTLHVTKATLTVTADDKSRGYGSANPEFTAAVAGLVNDDTLDSATTGAPVLTTLAEAMSAQGTYAIDVAAGTLAASNYEFALVDGTLTVTKAVLTITPEDTTKIYGAANPALTYKVSGYLNDDTAAVITGTPGLATTATDTSPVDAYPITADITALSATNYIFATEPGTLTVKKATLTVTAENQTRLYGAAEPTFTATITGFLHADTLDTAVTGAPAVATAATVTSAVGSYAITPAAGDLTAANYDFSFVPGTLAVTKAPLTVTSNNAAKVYGAALPTFTAMLSGFVNGETLMTSGVTGAADFTTAATVASGVNTYGIVPAAGTLAADNYSFTTFVPGTLTVTPAVLSVSAESQIKVYGSANPALSATITGFVNGEGAGALVSQPGVATNATTLSDVGTYAISVSGGASPNYTFDRYDGVLTVVKANQTIAFGGLGSLNVGDAATLAASASSGLPVTFSVVGGPARISGTTLATTGAGLVTVRASQAGSGNFNAAPSVERSFMVAVAPATITTPTEAPTPPSGGNARLEVATPNPNVVYQWQRNGADLNGATGPSLTITDAQPPTAGLYTYKVSVSDGPSGVSDPVIVGLTTAEKVIGTAEELGTDIQHPNGNVYDQLLLEGTATTFTANPGQVTRISFIDMSNDIVQVEFSGAGTLSLVMDNAGTPAPALSYNQPGIDYVRGHAGLVITGADETTNVTVFSVGRATAVNQDLFVDAVDYDGVADLAFIAIQSTDGQFGGVHTGNVNYYATQGFTGVYAPGVALNGALNLGEVTAFDSATPLIVVGSAGEARITGGSLTQSNGAPVRIDGIGQLRFVDGTTSHGQVLPAQANQAVIEESGAGVGSLIVVGP